MPPQSATVLVHVLMLLLTAHRDVTMSAMLFPFGSEAGDTVYTSEFDMTDAVSLPSPFTFYQTAYSTVYSPLTRSKGKVAVGFEDPRVDSSAPAYRILLNLGQFAFPWVDLPTAVVQEIPDDFITLTFPVICIFCADFGTAAQFPILVRLSANVTDLQTVQTLARQFSDFGSSFSPDWVLVVTWDDVPAFFETDPGNTLQLAIASNGTTSLVFMDYDDIGWLDGFSGATNINTKIGMVKGDGTHHYVFPESKSSNISLLVNRTNIGVDGQFLFR
ncbi:sushi, nidogen and EGF-like domain-containing protein 1 [Babylonia areolata]|uniref:sushi, nidogen and EGF-like domain-containing protein 1 n=1 Tax=Babylonia areolata TaxID=304850 RepID=UPI003FD4F3E5